MTKTDNQGCSRSCKPRVSIASLCALCCAVLIPIKSALAASEEFLTCQLSSSSYEQFESSIKAQVAYLQGHGIPVPSISILHNPTPNAFAIPSSNKIIISNGMLEMINSSGQQAFVLAHELAHLQLAPSQKQLNAFIAERSNPMEQAHEEAADRFALQLLLARDIPIRDGLELFEHITHRTDSDLLKARHQKLIVFPRQP